MKTSSSIPPTPKPLSWNEAFFDFQRAYLGASDLDKAVIRTLCQAVFDKEFPAPQPRELPPVKPVRGRLFSLLSSHPDSAPEKLETFPLGTLGAMLVTAARAIGDILDRYTLQTEDMQDLSWAEFRMNSVVCELHRRLTLKHDPTTLERVHAASRTGQGAGKPKGQEIEQ